MPPKRRHRLSLQNESIGVKVFANSKNERKKKNIASVLRTHIQVWIDESMDLPAGEQLDYIYEKMNEEMKFIRSDPQVNLPKIKVMVYIVATKNGKEIKYKEEF